jgi:hypothetical protein
VTAKHVDLGISLAVLSCQKLWSLSNDVCLSERLVTNASTAEKTRLAGVGNDINQNALHFNASVLQEPPNCDQLNRKNDALGSC